jgi:hypothetical protein
MRQLSLKERMTLIRWIRSCDRYEQLANLCDFINRQYSSGTELLIMVLDNQKSILYGSSH